MPHTVHYSPIGLLRTPFSDPADMPIQPLGAQDIEGRAEIDPQWMGGLADLEGFSHLILLYDFHRAGTYTATVTPFLDDTPRGLFATRAPNRPNPIGLSVIRLEVVRGSTLFFLGADMLDRTPLLDIKPYLPGFDAPGEIRCGWLEGRSDEARVARSDDRFSSGRQTSLK